MTLEEIYTCADHIYRTEETLVGIQTLFDEGDRYPDPVTFVDPEDDEDDLRVVG